MKKLLTILLLFVSVVSFGQTDLTFYHLGPATPQSTLYNAAYFPDASTYVSLPGLSGVHAQASTGFSYGDLFRAVPGTDSVTYDLNDFIANLKPGSRLSINGGVSLFQFGLKRGHRTFTITANARYDLNMLYPVQFMDYFISGNGAFLGQNVQEENISVNGISYWEMGLGYAQDLSLLDRPLRVGGRVKLLRGVAYLGTEKDAQVTLRTDSETFDMNVQFQNAVFQTAGLSAFDEDGDFNLNSGNNGLAVDLGATYQLNDKMDLALAINDIGSITWKNDTETYSLTENQINFIGFSGLDTLDIGEAFSDSLDIWTSNELTSRTFKTAIGPNIFASSSYKIYPKGSVTGTVGMLNSYAIRSQLIYGVGFTHQIQDRVYASTTLSGRGKQPLQVGAGLAARLGFFQLYTAVNNLSGLIGDPQNVQSVDFRFGINFLFGSKRHTEKRMLKKQQEAERTLGEETRAEF